ncbi:MAG TPA: trehalose-phosphatase [Thermomicrobiales bacterium]|nr:trehalose-phosphatase [Thermomicrobiales bacterium]
MTSASSVSVVAEFLGNMLQDRPSAVLSDFDGTLSHVSPTPDAALMAPGVNEVLSELVDRADLVGIVTGRGAADVMTKVQVSGLEYVGNHGLEWVDAAGHHVHPVGLAAETALPGILATIRERLAAEASLDGVIFEDKRYSASIHFRLADDPAFVGTVLDRIVQDIAIAHGLWVSPGKMVIELRPGERITKGTAVHRLAKDHGSKAMVFLGDDVTDTDAFLALEDLNRESGVATCSVGVLTPDTHPLVVERSDFLLDGVEEVVAMLSLLVKRLPVHSRSGQPQGGA